LLELVRIITGGTFVIGVGATIGTVVIIVRLAMTVSAAVAAGELPSPCKVLV
jgi:hypothetical protein